jgi:hypothetical protein
MKFNNTVCLRLYTNHFIHHKVPVASISNSVAPDFRQL